MEAQTFKIHAWTPKYYWYALIILLSTLTITYIVLQHRPLPIGRNGLDPTTALILFGAIACYVIAWLAFRNYVNTITINYKEKIIEATYIDPFKERTVKTHFKDFSF